MVLTCFMAFSVSVVVQGRKRTGDIPRYVRQTSCIYTNVMSHAICTSNVMSLHVKRHVSTRQTSCLYMSNVMSLHAKRHVSTQGIRNSQTSLNVHGMRATKQKCVPYESKHMRTHSVLCANAHHPILKRRSSMHNVHEPTRTPRTFDSLYRSRLRKAEHP